MCRKGQPPPASGFPLATAPLLVLALAAMPIKAGRSRAARTVGAAGWTTYLEIEAILRKLPVPKEKQATT